MKCLDCQYDLSAITSDKCPECGRVFDTNDPATFDGGERLTFGQVFDLAAYKSLLLYCCFPVLHVLSGYVALVAARVSLGRWPHRMGRDDPKSIDWIVSTLHWVWMITFLFAITMLVFVVPTLLVAACRLTFQRDSSVAKGRRSKWLILAAVILVTAIFFIDGRYDPAQISLWMTD